VGGDGLTCGRTQRVGGQGPGPLGTDRGPVSCPMHATTSMAPVALTVPLENLGARATLRQRAGFNLGAPRADGRTMASNGVERRIAERGPVGPIPVTFRATERSRGLLGGLRSAVITEPAYIVDLSVSGTGVVVREVSGLVVKSPVELSHEGHVATASVRRIVPRDDGRVMYGLDFTSMDPGMREFLFSQVEARRPGDLERQWLQAT
jgi:hypothetical protein